MRLAPRLRAAALLTLLALLPQRPAVAQDPASDPPPTDEAAAAGADDADAGAAIAKALQEAMPLVTEAHRHLAVHDWEECLPHFREAIAVLEPYPLLGGLRDQCLYNVACAEARLGRPGQAVPAFAASLEHGLRPVASFLADGRVAFVPGLTFAHVLVDPDLDSLRDRADFRAVLDGLLRAGTPLVEATEAAAGAADEARLPGVVVALASDHDLETGAVVWREALADVPAVLAFVTGPVRPVASARRWLLEDGDARFGADKVGEAVAALRADPRVDRARVVVVAASGGAAEVTLEAALARPGDVAGLVLGPCRFHAAWHADALAGLSAARAEAAPWRVAHVTGDERLGPALEAAGAEVTELAPPPPVVPAASRAAALRDTLVGALRAALE